MAGRREFMIGAAVAAAMALAGCAATAVDAGRDDAALHDHLLALETGSWQYVRDRDLMAMRAFLADDVLLIFSDGSHFDKEGYVASIADQTLTGLEVRDSRILRISPDVATLIYRVTYTTATKSHPAATVNALVSSTYVRRGGAWLSVLYQETPAGR